MALLQAEALMLRVEGFSHNVMICPYRNKANEKMEKHLNPLSVLHRVDELLPEDSIIVADGGDFVGSAAYIMRPRGPLCWLDPGQNRETCV